MHRFCWLRAVRLAWSSSVTSLTSPARCIGLSNRRSFGSFVFYVPFLVFIFAPRYSGRSWPFTENKAFTVITHRRPAAYLVSDKRKIQVYERVFRYWAKEKLGIAKKLTRRAILNFPDCMHSEIFIWHCTFPRCTFRVNAQSRGIARLIRCAFYRNRVTTGLSQFFRCVTSKLCFQSTVL